MKFSILLPTRNRLDLLAYAVESVLRQEYQDWEIVISDNDSEDDIKGYVDTLDDSRVRYVRTDEFVPVTENWNNALRHASGDYVIMLGDDDALMPNALNGVASLIAANNSPSVVYVDAWQYAYPMVVQGHESAFIQRGYTQFLMNLESRDPFFLSKKDASRLARSSMSFLVTFGFNMQHYFISREYIESTHKYGDFFQSPYPDYYAANMLMLLAEDILVCPTPMVVIGISPKSFGFYFSNKKEADGDAFLKHAYQKSIRERIEGVLLPGSSLMDCWLYAMETLKDRLSGTIDNLSVDYGRYRFVQVYMNYKASGWRGVVATLSRLRGTERIHFSLLFLYYALVRGLLPSSMSGKIISKRIPWPAYESGRTDVDAANILEAIDMLKSYRA